jgi:uncharacterized protein YoxC
MMKVGKPSNGRGAVADHDAPLGVSEELAVDAAWEVGVESDDEVVETIDEAAAYAEVGAHVASVLKAADEAATRIREEARDAAERIAEASRQEAATTLREANRDADKLLFEAEQRRAEADEAAKAVRDAADAYADQQRNEAHAQASRVIAEAEQETAERYETLQDNVVRTEERLERLVAGLRELAAGLEDVVHASASADEREATDSSIVEAAE